MNTRERWLKTTKERFMARGAAKSDDRGRRSEERFEAMVGHIVDKGRLGWFRGLAKASASDDWAKGIDYRMRVAAGGQGRFCEFSVLIQIKSSFRAALSFKAAHPNGDIHTIVMTPYMTPTKLTELLSIAYRKEWRRRLGSSALKAS